MANIFIHIPKTAGISIIRGLDGADMVTLGHDLRDPKYQHPDSVCTADDYIFTFVRNPFTRFLSAYHYLLKGGNCDEDAHDAYILGIKTMPVNSFIEKRLEQASQWQLHFLPQQYYIQNVPHPEIFYYEKLKDTFKMLCHKFSLPERKLPVRNRSKWDVDVSTLFSPRAIRIIRRVYAEDFQAFHYSTSPRKYNK